MQNKPGRGGSVLIVRGHKVVQGAVLALFVGACVGSFLRPADELTLEPGGPRLIASKTFPYGPSSAGEAT